MKSTRLMFPLVAFLCALAAGEIAFLLVKTELDNRQDRVLSTMSSTLAQSIQRQMAVVISSTNLLKIMLQLTNYETDRFDEWAATALTIYPSIAVLQLAPKGVIEKVYPLEEHINIIGHNLLEDHNRQDAAQLAIQNDELTLTGPVILRQNGRLGLIARLPITQVVDGKLEFWGFSIAIIYLDDLLKNAVINVEKNNLLYSLYGDNPDAKHPPLVARTKTLPSKPFKRIKVMVPNGNWWLTVSFKQSRGYLSVLIHLVIILTALVPGYVAHRSVSRFWQHEQALEAMNVELEQLANTDPLTRLPNRRSGTIYAEQQLAASRRAKADFSIAFLDIDFFKKVNDTYGHEVGDLALRHFSNTLSHLRRETDLLSRWGGEEFVLVLPATDKAGAKTICEIMRKKLSNSPLCYQQSEIKMTMSIGVATWSQCDTSLDDLIQRADAAVYVAKENGRNQVALS